MSTVFRVLPGTSQTPTVKDIVTGIEHLLRAFLAERDIQKSVKASFEIITEHNYTRPDSLRLFSLFRKPKPTPIIRRTPVPGEPFWWPENTYGWFTIKGVTGGCDCYAESNQPAEWPETTWCDELEDATRPGHAMPLKEMFQHGKEWRFRRSAGQLWMIELAYGFLAAQLANLTNGVITSIDGAWSTHLLPARADQFLEFYFNPADLRNSEDNRNRAERCIAALRT